MKIACCGKARFALRRFLNRISFSIRFGAMARSDGVIPDYPSQAILEEKVMKIGQDFGAHVVTMSPEDTIQEAAWKMRDQHVGSVIVAHGGKEIVGIVTD